MKVRVGIIMGSSSDWETMQGAADTLESLHIAHEIRVISAHRTPDLLFEYAEAARERGLKAIIAGAGGAAHLPGMTAAKTSVPVLGVPVQTKALGGIDSLLSIAQMPSGIPAATFAIGAAGAGMRRCSRRRSWPTSLPTCARPWMPFVQRRRPRYSISPIRASLEALERRHRRCGTTGAHDGARGVSPRDPMLVPGQERRRAGGSGRTDSDRRPRRPGASREARLQERRAHLRLGEHLGKALAPLESLTRVRPPRAALEISQDRLQEKALFKRLSILVAEHAPVDSREDLANAAPSWASREC